MNKKNRENPYATVRGGKVEAPRKNKEEPKATRTTANDLRVKRS